MECCWIGQNRNLMFVLSEMGSNSSKIRFPTWMIVQPRTKFIPWSILGTSNEPIHISCGGGQWNFTRPMIDLWFSYCLYLYLTCGMWNPCCAHTSWLTRAKTKWFQEELHHYTSQQPFHPTLTLTSEPPNSQPIVNERAGLWWWCYNEYVATCMYNMVSAELQF